MGRPEGFLWTYPGMHSIVVPYHDSNDFYFSGHIGSCVLIAFEYRAAKWKKMSYVSFFVMANQWIMLMFVRTHYIIDLVGGFIISHYIYILSDKLSFFIDVKIMGLADKMRFYYHNKPCKACGWGNKYAGDFMFKEEKLKLKEAF